MGFAPTASGNTLYQKPLETMLFERQGLSNARRLLKSVRCESGHFPDSQPLCLTEQSWVLRGMFKREHAFCYSTHLQNSMIYTA